jgi:signal transduction histidine kinase
VQARDQFLSIASHELRTPLTALMGYASMLQVGMIRGAGTDPALQRQADMIVRQTTRLNKLLEQLLDVSRLQQGQFTVEPQPVEFGALIAHVVDEFRLSVPDEGPHTITLLRPDEAMLVLGDPLRLEEIVHNLLSNAVKYSPQGGLVEVRVTATPLEVALEVEDQGIGIPADAQALLFEPFYRASNVSRQSSGFGIGLYVTQQFVLLHGGRIEIESSEGGGSCFQVVLPRHTADAARDDGRESSAQ